LSTFATRQNITKRSEAALPDQGKNALRSIQIEQSVFPRESKQSKKNALRSIQIEQSVFFLKKTKATKPPKQGAMRPAQKFGFSFTPDMRKSLRRKVRLLGKTPSQRK
jgi:hypothetical protein